jgi:hypothetical protein
MCWKQPAETMREISFPSSFTTTFARNPNQEVLSRASNLLSAAAAQQQHQPHTQPWRVTKSSLRPLVFITTLFFISCIPLFVPPP